jgi:phosphoglycolate phosphatase-like HAD superfamily hydrolase
MWLVGDSIDDMKCGRGAGCKTCLILNPANAHLPQQQPELIDLAVATLSEFVSALDLE